MAGDGSALLGADGAPPWHAVGVAWADAGALVAIALRFGVGLSAEGMEERMSVDECGWVRGGSGWVWMRAEGEEEGEEAEGEREGRSSVQIPVHQNNHGCQDNALKRKRKKRKRKEEKNGNCSLSPQFARNGRLPPLAVILPEERM